jgi:predicted NAD/FAD-dependent oxidoreductase
MADATTTDPKRIAELEAEVTALHAERDRLKGFEGAIIDASVVNWTYRKEHETNPHKAIADLIACITQEALDPAISKSAHDLVQRAEQAEAEAARLRAALEAARYMAQFYGGDRVSEHVETAVEAALASSGTVPERPKNSQN